MSLKIDEYLSYTGALSTTAAKSTASATTAAETSKEGDSYISTIGSSDEAIPCENYNDFARVLASAKSEQDGSSTETNTSAQGVGEASGASGSGSSESEEETTTEIVTINGITYLQTTTVENGVTTVERTAIGGQGVQSVSDEE